MINMTMKVCELITEARSHKEKNIKIPTSQIFKSYENNNSIYVHFNNIEKVGVNFQSNNTYGPIGIYAMPIDIATSYGLNVAKLYNKKYANILRLKSTANVLDLNTVDISTMESLVKKAMHFHKKKFKNKADFYNMQMPSSVKDCWKLIENLLYDYSRRRGKILMYLENIFLRNAGYDAVLDYNSIINDNPRQIVFLSTQAFDLVKTIPIRYN